MSQAKSVQGWLDVHKRLQVGLFEGVAGWLGRGDDSVSWVPVARCLVLVSKDRAGSRAKNAIPKQTGAPLSVAVARDGVAVLENACRASRPRPHPFRQTGHGSVRKVLLAQSEGSCSAGGWWVGSRMGHVKAPLDAASLLHMQDTP